MLEKGLKKKKVHGGVSSLGVLFLVVVAEEQAGDGTAAVRQPLVETPVGHGVPTSRALNS